MRFTNTITIDRPPATVFAYLADLENLPRWNYALAETRQAHRGPPGVGTRYRQTRTIPVHAEESLEMIEFDPDRQLTIQGTLNAFPRRSHLHPRPERKRHHPHQHRQPPTPSPADPPGSPGTRPHQVRGSQNLAVLKQLLEQP